MIHFQDVVQMVTVSLQASGAIIITIALITVMRIIAVSF